MSVRITCIKKDNGNHENPHCAISVLGWLEDGTNSTGQASRIAIYDWIKSGGIAYVKDALGNRANLQTAITAKGTKYVKTIADETKLDNLLKLDECK